MTDRNGFTGNYAFAPSSSTGGSGRSNYFLIVDEMSSQNSGFNPLQAHRINKVGISRYFRRIDRFLHPCGDRPRALHVLSDLPALQFVEPRACEERNAALLAEYTPKPEKPFTEATDPS
jgi:hypothetical protein